MAEAIIALTAFLKSARLLMAQKASNQTASCERRSSSRWDARAASRLLRPAYDNGSDQPGNRHHRRPRWLGRCVRSCSPNWRCVVARLVPPSIKFWIRSPTQAAILELFAAAARTRIVPANPSEWLPVGLIEHLVGIAMLIPLVGLNVVPKAMPAR
jgi:hypothetical protein